MPRPWPRGPSMTRRSEFSEALESFVSPFDRLARRGSDSTLSCLASCALISVNNSGKPLAFASFALFRVGLLRPQPSLCS